MNKEYDWVAVGNVARGDYMRRYEAEASEIEYTELTQAEVRQINYLIENPRASAWEVVKNS